MLLEVYLRIKIQIFKYIFFHHVFLAEQNWQKYPSFVTLHVTTLNFLLVQSNENNLNITSTQEEFNPQLSSLKLSHNATMVSSNY